MERTITVRGRLDGPKRIDLDEPVNDVNGEVEVVVTPLISATATDAHDVFEFLRSLPLGTRSKADIDRQVAAERDSWDKG